LTARAGFAPLSHCIEHAPHAVQVFFLPKAAFLPSRIPKMLRDKIKNATPPAKSIGKSVPMAVSIFYITRLYDFLLLS